MSVRLNVYIAQGSEYSRRKADTLIQSGEVTVNGEIVRQPYYQVQDSDNVCVGRQKIIPHKKQYVLLNKPKGYTCTCDDRHADHIVTELLPVALRELYPVGRLDKNSRGMLLLTNDGDFCFRVTHPGFEVEKEYRVTVAGAVSKADIGLLQAKKGLSIEGEWYSIRSVRVIQNTEQESILSIVCAEGKKRHVRMILEALGYRVRDLQRVRIGRLGICGLEEGAWRHLNEKEQSFFKLCRQKNRGE